MTAAAPRPAEPDFDTVTAEELSAYREAENRFRASAAVRAVTGQPDPGASIEWREVALPDREVPVRVHLPAGHDGGPLPLVVQVHGGGFVGTAPQCDWANSRIATALPAAVVAVEQRLLDFDTPFSAGVDDAWDVLRRILGDAGAWNVDPGRVALLGESGGGLIAALTAIRARDAGLPVRAQVLVNPAVDVTGAMLDHPSIAEYADSPSLKLPVLDLVRRIAVPPGADPRGASPLHAGDLGRLAPALVVVPTADPLADHGRAYAARLRAAGTPARLSEYEGAGHAFLSTPGIAPQAVPALAEILGFLREALSA